MKFATIIGGAAVLALAPFGSAAFAQTAFDGTFTMDEAKTEFSKVPSVTSLKDGTFSCVSCRVKYTVPADGKFHDLPDNSFVDAVAVKVVDANTLNYRWMKDGKVVGMETDVVQSDGNTLIFNDEWTTPNGSKEASRVVQKRVGSAMPGEHLATGKFVTMESKDTSPTKYSRTMKVEGDKFVINDSSGMSYSAPIGGGWTPVSGLAGNAEVAVTRPSDDMLVERWRADGKMTGLSVVQPGEEDGTLKIISVNLATGGVNTLTIYRK